MSLQGPQEDKSHSQPSQPRKAADRSRHIRGQHSIEYLIMLTLIMAGIIIMGRYVVRSWNANLKGWEDSAMDSLTDPFSETTIDFPGCDAGPWVDQGCGITQANHCSGEDFVCTPQERLFARTFTPFGCECGISVTPPPNLKCTVDSCCCSIPQLTGACSSNATFPGTPEPACTSNTPAMTPKNPDGTCPAGMAEAWVLCGGDADPDGRRYGCVPDPNCVNICTGAPQKDWRVVSLCTGDSYGLTADTDYTYVPQGGCSSPTGSDPKCQIECKSPAVPDPGGNGCICPYPLIEHWRLQKCVCRLGPGQIMQYNACPVGQCDTVSCGSNACMNYWP